MRFPVFIVTTSNAIHLHVERLIPIAERIDVGDTLDKWRQVLVHRVDVIRFENSSDGEGFVSFRQVAETAHFMPTSLYQITNGNLQVTGQPGRNDDFVILQFRNRAAIMKANWAKRFRLFEVKASNDGIHRVACTGVGPIRRTDFVREVHQCGRGRPSHLACRRPNRIRDCVFNDHAVTFDRQIAASFDHSDPEADVFGIQCPGQLLFQAVSIGDIRFHHRRQTCCSTQRCGIRSLITSNQNRINSSRPRNGAAATGDSFFQIQSLLKGCQRHERIIRQLLGGLKGKSRRPRVFRQHAFNIEYHFNRRVFSLSQQAVTRNRRRQFNPHRHCVSSDCVELRGRFVTKNNSRVSRGFHIGCVQHRPVSRSESQDGHRCGSPQLAGLCLLFNAARQKQRWGGMSRLECFGGRRA